MIRTLLVLLLAFVSFGSAQAEGDRLFYSKFFKGSTPEYQEIILSPDGACKYKEATDDPNPIEFTLPEAMRTEMFQLAAELGYFTKPLESNLAIAKMERRLFASRAATPARRPSIIRWNPRRRSCKRSSRESPNRSSSTFALNTP